MRLNPNLVTFGLTHVVNYVSSDFGGANLGRFHFTARTNRHIDATDNKLLQQTANDRLHCCCLLANKVENMDRGHRLAP